jgi:short-chain fatty acids transporter
MTSATEESRSEKGLARVAQSLASWTEKWFPDAYVVALAGVFVVTVAALANGSSPQTVANAFGNGFWDLTAFTLQMAMVVLTGYVVATSPPVARLIDRLAGVPQSARSAVSFVAFLSMSVSFLNWGLSLVFGGLLARAIARRTDLRVDYRALGAAAFMGLGAVWALGMSSSAAQLQATASSLPDELLKITGVLDFGTTIFTWQSLLTCAILIALTVVIAHFSAPRGVAIKTAEDLNVDLDDQTEEVPPRERPGEWLEYSRVLPVLAGLMTLGWLISQLVTKPALTVVSSLNGYLLVFLILGSSCTARHAGSCRLSPRRFRPQAASSSSFRSTPPWPRSSPRQKAEAAGRSRICWRNCSRTSAAGPSPSSSRSTRSCSGSSCHPAAESGWSRRPTSCNRPRTYT